MQLCLSVCMSDYLFPTHLRDCLPFIMFAWIYTYMYAPKHTTTDIYEDMQKKNYM